jgi:hypothetical protein
MRSILIFDLRDKVVNWARSLRLRSQQPWGPGRGETTRKIFLGELACVRGVSNLSEVFGGSQPNN